MRYIKVDHINYAISNDPTLPQKVQNNKDLNDQVKLILPDLSKQTLKSLSTEQKKAVVKEYLEIEKGV